MKIAILAIGTTHKNYLEDGVSEFIARIRRYVPFEEIVIPEEKKWKKLSPEERKKAEAAALESSLESGDLLILLDEKGKHLTSVEFSDYLQKKMNAGPKRIVFAIGGPYGFADSAYKACHDRISLSKMTFSHQMVRLFALEQIYRAFTILKNEPYHNE